MFVFDFYIKLRKLKMFMSLDRQMIMDDMIDGCYL